MGGGPNQMMTQQQMQQQGNIQQPMPGGQQQNAQMGFGPGGPNMNPGNQQQQWPVPGYNQMQQQQFYNQK